jgi:serine/threonine-protein kinase
MRDEACQATAVRHEQSGELLDRRMACLDRRLHQIAGLVGILAKEPDATVLERAVSAVSQLEPLAPCADRDALFNARPPPADPAVRGRLAALAVRISEGVALYWTGKYAAADTELTAVVAEARAIGDPATLATSLNELAQAKAALRQVGPAERLAREALRLAAEVRDGALEADTWLLLVFLVNEAGRSEESATLAAAADAALRRIGDPAPARARLLIGLARTLRTLSRLDEARRTLGEAIALADAGAVSALETADILAELEVILERQGQLEEALATRPRVEALYVKELGAEHPFHGRLLLNFAKVLAELEDRAGARAALDEAMRILERTEGPEHPDLGTALTYAAMFAATHGDYAEAELLARRALAIREKAFGPDSLPVAATLGVLAEALYRQGHGAEARAPAVRALAVREKVQGPAHPDVAGPLVLLGLIDLHDGRAAEAEATADRALTILAHDTGPELCERLRRVAEIMAAQHRTAEALGVIERAEAVPARSGARARLAFLRARVELELGRDRATAVRRARDALAVVCKEDGPAAVSDSARIEAWLAAR